MIWLTILLFGITSDIPPYFVGFEQPRTLFAQDEPVVLILRFGNQSENVLKNKNFPDIFAHLTLESEGEVFQPTPKAKSDRMFRKLLQLEINQHKDFRLDMRKIFPKSLKAGVYILKYSDENSISQSLPFKVLPIKMPNLESKFLIETSMGNITVKLSPLDAPNHVRNFAMLVQDGFYKDMIFHRVVRGKIIQSGDPEGTGLSGSGFPVMLEASPFLKNKAFNLGAARGSDKHSATSQFYICAEDFKELDGDYTVFGKVVDGQDVVKAISMVGTSGPRGNPPEKPFEDVILKQITTIEP